VPFASTLGQLEVVDMTRGIEGRKKNGYLATGTRSLLVLYVGRHARTERHLRKMYVIYDPRLVLHKLNIARDLKIFSVIQLVAGRPFTFK
jgi:hypothetical protein